MTGPNLQRGARARARTSLRDSLCRRGDVFCAVSSTPKCTSWNGYGANRRAQRGQVRAVVVRDGTWETRCRLFLLFGQLVVAWWFRATSARPLSVLRFVSAGVRAVAGAGAGPDSGAAGAAGVAGCRASRAAWVGSCPEVVGGDLDEGGVLWAPAGPCHGLEQAGTAAVGHRPGPGGRRASGTGADGASGERRAARVSCRSPRPRRGPRPRSAAQPSAVSHSGDHAAPRRSAVGRAHPRSGSLPAAMAGATVQEGWVLTWATVAPPSCL